MPGLAHYMTRYDHEHSSASNKLLHGIGIPLIFAGIVLLALLRWKSGAFCFIAGWVLLFLGHRIEGNNPAFFQGPIYLLVGPVWVAKELCSFLTGTHRGQNPEDMPLKRH
jgi:uncharacterized membrane protein YGL010W